MSAELYDLDTGVKVTQVVQEGSADQILGLTNALSVARGRNLLGSSGQDVVPNVRLDAITTITGHRVGSTLLLARIHDQRGDPDTARARRNANGTRGRPSPRNMKALRTSFATGVRPESSSGSFSSSTSCASPAGHHEPLPGRRHRGVLARGARRRNLPPSRRLDTAAMKEWAGVGTHAASRVQGSSCG